MPASPLHGKTGAIYTPAGYIKANTISFTNSPAKILDSGSGLVTAGFASGQSVVVTGSTQEENNKTYTLGTVAAGNMVVSPAPVTKTAGDLITVVVAAPGTVGTGFFNWEMTHGGNLSDATDFSDAGVKKFIAGSKEWSFTAERFHDTTDTTVTNPETWLNTIKFVRLFVKYVASPSGGDPAYYYEGVAILKNCKTINSKDEIVKMSMDFQGISTIPTLITKTTSW